MFRSAPHGPAGRPWHGRVSCALVLLVGGLVSGCLPELEAQCSVNEDCPTDRPVCVAEVCTPRIGDGGPPPSDGAVPADGGDQDQDPDARVDGAVDDGGVDPCTVTGPEVCNGLDDDCDGQTDEVAGGQPLSRPCYTGAPETQGIGVCHAGRATCVDGAYGACEGEVAPREEVCAPGDPDCAGLCNGNDDDCDGEVDEGLERACGPEAEIGLCRRGVEICTGGFWQACEGAVPPAVDICDGQDNDCDLAVDEGADSCQCVAGESRDCYSGAGGTDGVGACVLGRQECGDNGNYGACADEVIPVPERCDGVDDDCDGTTDERLGGLPCTAGRGACQRPGMTVCDAGEGRMVCDAVMGEPTDELCNGLDDDCDGTTDEGFRVGEACGRGMGACRAVGERVCLEGRAVCDAVAGEPGDERCNGIDDDCDGNTDERPDGLGPLEQSCYDQPGGSPGVGACVEGVQACVDGAWGPCDGDQRPFPERCNGEDDDCNGMVDDVEGGCSCTVGQQQPCFGGPEGTENVGVCRAGTQRCVELDGGGTGFGMCQGEVLPGDELCNGADDDCDGVVDEGEFGVCAAGVGACATEGVVACVGGAAQCQAEAGLPTDEQCNGVDDDCNGLIDDIPVEACEVGVGACRNTGMLRCGADGPECDVVPGNPLPIEICNGIDDDCDAATDEMVVAGPCEVGVGACAAQGREVCTDGVLLCEGRAGDPAPEICNGEDDDCDGAVDEGPFGVCTVGEGNCAVDGVVVCVDGAPACEAQGEPPAEVCNGADDDCDGNTDENPADLCGAPPNGVAECVQAACNLTCDARFYDPDGDPANGCERGCDPRVSGVAIATSGVPLAVAARPDLDEFAIAWIDRNGAPWMSIEGAAAFALDPDGVLRGETIQIVGVRHGYSVLVGRDAAGWAIDVRVDGGAAASIQVFGGADGVPGLVLTAADPEPQANEDGVPGIQHANALNAQGDGALIRLPRTFGADFGAGVALDFAQSGWAPRAFSTSTVGDRALVVGVAQIERQNSEVRAFFLDGQGLASTSVQAVIDGATRTVVDTRGTAIVVGHNSPQGVSFFGFEEGDANLGQPVPAGAGVVVGAQYGAAGPVMSILENRDLGGIGLRVGANGLEPVYGPLLLVTLGPGSAGSIDAAAATLTSGERRIVVWRDRGNNVRWAINPCF